MNNVCNADAKDSGSRGNNAERSLNSAILGIAPVSHGAKLPPHIDPEEMNKFMSTFNYWRQTRMDKLTQRILAKGKHVNTAKPSASPQPKPKTSNLATKKDVKQGHCDGKKNVFERLYEKPLKNNVTKELEESKNGKLNYVKKLQNNKPLLGQIKEKKRKIPKIIVTSEEEKTSKVILELSSKDIESHSVAEEITSELVEDLQDPEINHEQEKFETETAIDEHQIPLLEDSENTKKNVNVQDDETVSNDINGFEKEETVHASEEKLDVITGNMEDHNTVEVEEAGNGSEEKVDYNITENVEDHNIIEVEEAGNGSEEKVDYNITEQQANSDIEERDESKTVEEKVAENDSEDKKQFCVIEEQVDDDNEERTDEKVVEAEEADIEKQLNKLKTDFKKGKPFKSLPKNRYRPRPKTSLRRTASLIFHTKTDKKAIQRTQSDWSLNELKEGEVEVSKIIPQSNNDHCETDNSRKNAVDKQPIKEKKSVCFFTPRPSALSVFHMRNKLENWLVENGHSIDTYRHLRCFGLSAEKTPRPPQYRQQKLDESFNASFYSTAPNTPMPEIVDESDKENVTPPVLAPRVEKVDTEDVEGWLSDLHSLIVHVKYPGDRCEEWLNAIAKKFPNCTQLEIYWECLAAMGVNYRDNSETEKEEDNKSKNDEVGEHLAELLDQLVIDEKCGSVSKTERGLSAKNIFTSKTVKFALKEKTMKQTDSANGTEACQKVLVATPVRRSARVRIPDKSNVITSLKSLDPDVRRSLSFKPNEALFTG